MAVKTLCSKKRSSVTLLETKTNPLTKAKLKKKRKIKNQ